MITRRSLALGMPLYALLDGSGPVEQARAATGTYRIPGKSEPHARTWMQWPARTDIWGNSDNLEDARRTLAGVARAVAHFEEVVMLVRPDQMPNAASHCGTAVKLLAMPVDDLWAADSGPMFVIDERGSLAVVDLNFNGWGNKQVHEEDARVARRVAEYCRVPRLDSGFVADGGAIEVDGDGTLVTTESTLINDNRNPGIGKAHLEEKLKSAFGLKKIIWLPGLRGADVTDGHPDAFVRYVRPGVVVAELPAEQTGIWYGAAKEAIAILKAASDARGRKLDVVILHGPATIRSDVEEFAASYLGFHPCNGGVVMPEFGDKTGDRLARETLAKLFPDRTIVQLNADRIAEGGGSIHCVTRQEPVVR